MRREGRIHVFVAGAVAAASFLACSGDQPATQGSNSPSPAASPSGSPEEKVAQPLPPPVSLGRLPSEGVLVSNNRATLLLDLSGRVVERLPKFGIAGNQGAPGIWLQRSRQYFRLEVGRRQLTPVARKNARAKMYDEGQEPDLPPPDDARVNGRVAGGWRYAYRSGDRTLAQWSGECEIPTAFWIEGDSLRIITGETGLAHAPESLALGWSSSGDAIVILGEGACGQAGNPPGIYRFTAPGEGALIYETSGYVSAEMW